MRKRFDLLRVLVAAAAVTVLAAIPIVLRAQQRVAELRAELTVRRVQLQNMKARSEARKGEYPWTPAAGGASQPSR